MVKIRGTTAGATALVIGGLCTHGAHAAELLVNPFHDPFAQLTHGLAACPVPSPPSYTHAEMVEVEHHRVERGNSCYLAGKCRYASSFMYDRGIAAGLFPALARDPSLRDSSIWAWVEGRTVQLLGCVRDSAQLAHARGLAEHWPDVQTVLPGLMLGTAGAPPYTVDAGPARPGAAAAPASVPANAAR